MLDKACKFELLPGAWIPLDEQLAEGQGFEPWVESPPQRFSRPSRSAAPASLRGCTDTFIFQLRQDVPLWAVSSLKEVPERFLLLLFDRPCEPVVLK